MVTQRRQTLRVLAGVASVTYLLPEKIPPTGWEKSGTDATCIISQCGWKQYDYALTTIQCRTAPAMIRAFVIATACECIVIHTFCQIKPIV